MKRIIVVFGIIFLIFIIVVFFQVNKKSINNFFNKSSVSTVTVNSATFRVDIVKTQKEKEQGLSGRRSLATDDGMLFLFDKPSYYSFWMRDMKFPLDIIFILNDKVVGVYRDLQPASADANPPQYGSEVVADKVLEINAGEAAKNNIKVGDAIIIEINK